MISKFSKMSVIFSIIVICFLLSFCDIRAQNNNKKNTKDEIYNKCNNGERLCFGSPDGCIKNQNCKILGTSFLNDGKIKFNLLAPIEQNQNSIYVAYSLSKTATMGGSVAHCYLDDKMEPRFGLSYNPYNSHDNELVENVDGIEPTTFEYIEGTLHCAWNRQPNTKVKDETIDLANNKYYIQLAKGAMDLNKLTHHSEKRSSKEPSSLLSVGLIKAGGISPYIKWHGCLMIFAWVGCVSTGIIMARYYRDDWSSVTILGVKVWFFVHRLIMATGWVSMMVSIILIWYYKKGWSGPKAHPVLGLLSVLFATLQIINSWFRPNPGSDKRWIFDWIHWAEGNLAHILAFCAILMAHILWVKRLLPESFFWVFMSFIFFYLLIQDSMKKLISQKSEPNYSKSSTQESFNIEEQYQTKRSTNLTKNIVLWIYIIIAFALVLTLIVLIANF